MAKKRGDDKAATYVATERKKGFSDESIMRAMLDAGWKAAAVAAALENPKLPEHVVARNKSFTLDLERFKDVHWSAWLSLIASSLWLAIYFRPEGVGGLLIGTPLFGLILGSFLSYEHTKKEAFLKVSMLFNASLLALALFTLYLWLVSFILVPMQEQLLLVALLPGLLLIFFAQEYGYHFWLGTHDQHALYDRTRRAVIYTFVNFIIVFLIIAIVSGVAFAKLANNYVAHYEEFSQMQEEVKGFLNEEDEVYQELQEQIRFTGTPPVTESMMTMTEQFLFFKKPSTLLLPVLERGNEMIRYTLKVGLYSSNLARTAQQDAFFQQRGMYYDGTSTQEEHLAALRKGNERLSAAVENVGSTAETPGAGLIMVCNKEQNPIGQPNSLASATSVRFLCASDMTQILYQEITLLGSEITTIKDESEAFWSEEKEESVQSAIIRNEVERNILQNALINTLEKMTYFGIRESGSPQENEASRLQFAEEHANDPYIGPLVCEYLPQESCQGICFPFIEDFEGGFSGSMNRKGVNERYEIEPPWHVDKLDGDPEDGNHFLNAYGKPYNGKENDWLTLDVTRGGEYDISFDFSIMNDEGFNFHYLDNSIESNVFSVRPRDEKPLSIHWASQQGMQQYQSAPYDLGEVGKTWHHVEIENNKGVSIVSLNGEEIFRLETEAGRKGMMSFETIGDGFVMIDNIKVESEDGTIENSCAQKWSLAYNEVKYCEEISDSNQRNQCRTAVAQEENSINSLE